MFLANALSNWTQLLPLAHTGHHCTAGGGQLDNKQHGGCFGVVHRPHYSATPSSDLLVNLDVAGEKEPSSPSLEG